MNQIDTEAAAGEEKDYTIGNKTPVRGACGRFATDSVFEQKKDRCAFQQSIDGEILVEESVGCTVMEGNNDRSDKCEKKGHSPADVDPPSRLPIDLSLVQYIPQHEIAGKSHDIIQIEHSQHVAPK